MFFIKSNHCFRLCLRRLEHSRRYWCDRVSLVPRCGANYCRFASDVVFSWTQSSSVKLKRRNRRPDLSEMLSARLLLSDGCSAQHPINQQLKPLHTQLSWILWSHNICVRNAMCHFEWDTSVESSGREVHAWLQYTSKARASHLTQNTYADALWFIPWLVLSLHWKEYWSKLNWTFLLRNIKRDVFNYVYDESKNEWYCQTWNIKKHHTII